MTFPRNVGQIPIYYNHKNTGRPVDPQPGANMVFWSHYSDKENVPLFPFAYGLSYTSFNYSNLNVEKESYAVNEEVQISVELSNDGDYDGKEVVQLYIRDLFAKIVRPVRELKGFQLVELKKGESKIIKFSLTSEELGFYDQDGNFTVEPGEFEIFVGTDSNASLKTHFLLKE